LWIELILLFATFFLPGFLLQAQAGSGQSFNNPLYSISVLLQAIPQTLLIVYIVHIGGKGNLEEFGFREVRWKDLQFAVLTLVATFAVLIPLQALLESPGTGEGVFEWSFENLAIAPLVLFAMVAAAYREEVFFRAYTLRRLNQLGIPVVWAAAASTTIFALGHLYQGLSGFAVSFAIGLLMCGIFLRTGSLHAIGIGHGLYNFAVLLAAGAGGP
jgi:hypothetical protein